MAHRYELGLGQLVGLTKVLLTLANISKLISTYSLYNDKDICTSDKTLLKRYQEPVDMCCEML